MAVLGALNGKAVIGARPTIRYGPGFTGAKRADSAEGAAPADVFGVVEGSPYASSSLGVAVPGVSPAGGLMIE